jgi:hypothetical protein
MCHLLGFFSKPSTIFHNHHTVSTFLAQSFQLLKFDPSFSKDGISYNWVEACNIFIFFEADDAVDADPI